MALGAAASIIQRVTFPSVPFTSMWIHACGLIQSIFVTVPLSFTGFVESNSAANAWCAQRDAGTSIKAATATRSILVRIGLSSLFLLRGFRCGFFIRTGTTQLIHHAIVSLVARVFKVLVTLLLADREREREWRRVSSGILDSHRVLNGLLVRACQTLGELCVFAERSASAVAADSRLVS